MASTLASSDTAVGSKSELCASLYDAWYFPFSVCLSHPLFHRSYCSLVALLSFLHPQDTGIAQKSPRVRPSVTLKVLTWGHPFTTENAHQDLPPSPRPFVKRATLRTSRSCFQGPRFLEPPYFSSVWIALFIATFGPASFDILFFITFSVRCQLFIMHAVLIHDCRLLKVCRPPSLYRLSKRKIC